MKVWTKLSGWTSRSLLASVLAMMAATSAPVHATETENLNLQILPAPGKMTIDGKFDDWDLSGGIFACGDVEHQRTISGVWINGMYDKDNLYLLAHFVDATPMNNPGSIKGSYGFNGDCLQFRVVTAFGTPLERISHWTCWSDHDGLDVMGATYGKKFNEGNADAKTSGGQQAFIKDADGKGYVQEMSIPWKMLTREGVTLKPGDQIMITVEPNFSINGVGRLTIKDIFKPNVGIDRVFTFQGPACWGYGSLETKGHVKPRPVRLSDGREFAVSFEKGLPVIDWAGLIKSSEPDGFKVIKFNLPEDGYVSLNIFDSKGAVARQLLMTDFLTKGPHEVKWDGLATPSVRRPGQIVSAGEYHWEAIYHTGIGLRLKGWADSGGVTPWDGNDGRGSWGADHGNPVAAASDDKQIYLGWISGEGGKPLVATDLDGRVRWKNIRGGIAGATLLASDGSTLYAFNPQSQYAAVAIYRLDAKSGNYTEWSSLKSTDLTIQKLLGDEIGKGKNPSGLAAKGGRVFISVSALNKLLVVDANTGELIKQIDIEKPGSVQTRDGKQVDVLTSGRNIVSVDVDGGEIKPIVAVPLKDKEWVSAIATDKDGNLYASVRDGREQVLVFSREGQLLRAIGREGGRALVGPWNPDGMLVPSGITVDAKGKLWVTENDGTPRRISVWDAATGKFLKEFFGGSAYGAGGGAINPIDPNLMVGQGAEWRLDPNTGKATCIGTLPRIGDANAKFGFGKDHRLYLATTPDSMHGTNPVNIMERLGDGVYKLRTTISRLDKETLKVWADQNDDGVEQPEEAQTYKLPTDLGAWISGWYLPMTQDLTIYGTTYKFGVTGWTACGAPLYDFTKAVKMPEPEKRRGRGGMGAQLGCGSADGHFMLYNGHYGDSYSTFDCYNLDTGTLAWTYPNNFVGVHGSHQAGGPEPGLIRGAFDIVGSVQFPAPLGNLWLIPTNKGEWHILNDKGFYISKLFESDPMKWSYPEFAVPGAVLDSCPPGAGEEAFGGSLTKADDGKLYIQVGHTSFWNVEVVGLETVKAIPGSTITLTEDDLKTAQTYYNRGLQESVGIKSVAVRHFTPTFTGEIAKDFANTNIQAYKKQDNASARTVLSWDEQNLYVAWEVKDETPWVNGADAPEFMYITGDTVDIQLGTDPNAPKTRKEAVLGDLRLSIGNFKGKPTAVVYRRVATEKNPKMFSSGVVKAYTMESVTTLADAKIEATADKKKRQYVVEAAIPLASLGLKITDDMKIRGDFGVTHGDKATNRTVLRTYWSNQSTGIVSDAVYELQMEPGNWGDLTFTK